MIQKKNQSRPVNIKSESNLVKDFVTLLTTPTEDNSVQKHVDEFKVLSEEKQSELVQALKEHRSITDDNMNLMLKILTLSIPSSVKNMILSKYNHFQQLEPTNSEYFKLRGWLDKVVSIPFGTYQELPVHLNDGTEKCQNFIENIKSCLDNAVYGQEQSKLQLLQHISTQIVNPKSRGLALLLVGPAGIGKTSIIKNGLAKALNWPFQFISLGGDSDATTYTGHQLVYESSNCGKIVNSLITAKSMSTILMFDEVDKISDTSKGEEVKNVLIHLTDPIQNMDFEDKYLSGIPIDLSKVMFIFTANDVSYIDSILLDRMIVIELKGYDLKQKLVIAEQYLLPLALESVYLNNQVFFSKEVLSAIIERYASKEEGVRELKRCLDQIVQKINMLRMYPCPTLPFYIKDFKLPYTVLKEHLPLFLTKKEEDGPPFGMYL